METLIKLFPYGLLGYFLYRSYKDSIYFMIIPFLIFFRFCILFETVKIFAFPYDEHPALLFTFWLIVFWIIYIIRRAYFEEKTEFIRSEGQRHNVIDYLIFALMIISILGLLLVMREYNDMTEVSTQFIILFSLFIGYLIIRNVFKRMDTEDISDFLFQLALINTIASLLYIAHQGLRLPIYEGEEYTEEVVQGILITRTFWFMPILWFFTIAYLLVFLKRSPMVYITMIVVNLVALFISYTRSFLMVAILMVLLYYFLNAIKERNYSTLVRNLFVMAIAGLLFFFALSRFMPASTEYFLARFTEMKNSPADEESNTLIYRFIKTGEVFEKVETNEAFLGYGPITKYQLPYVEVMEAITADMVWSGVVFRWGYTGLFLFILLYSAAIIHAFRIYIREEGLRSKLALVLLLLIITQVLEGFTSWTFLSPNRYALGLWYFGFLSALMSSGHGPEEEQEDESETQDSYA